MFLPLTIFGVDFSLVGRRDCPAFNELPILGGRRPRFRTLRVPSAVRSQQGADRPTRGLPTRSGRVRRAAAAD